MLKKILDRTDGQDLAEYAILLGAIAIVVIVAVALLGTNLSDLFAGLGVELGLLLNPDPDPDPVPDCYGSLLLPIMVGITGLTTAISRWLPKQRAMA
jgi:Flp pilus assembly pilin Flp